MDCFTIVARTPDKNLGLEPFKLNSNWLLGMYSLWFAISNGMETTQFKEGKMTFNIIITQENLTPEPTFKLSEPPSPVHFEPGN